MKFSAPVFTVLRVVPLFFLAGCAVAPDAFIFDSSVSGKHRNYFNDDIQFLSEQNFPRPSEEDLRIMGVPDSRGVTFVAYIKERMKYVIGEGYDDSSTSNVTYTEDTGLTPVLGVLSLTASLIRGVSELELGLGPTEQTVSAIPRDEKLDGPQLFGATVMSNFGSGYYRYGIEKQRRYKVRIARNFIDILTPRVGIIQIGEALFNQSYRKTPFSSMSSLAAKLDRCSTYKHEGRHGDGSKMNGNNAGFPHEKCPAGHDFAGSYACDKYINAAYGVNSRFLKTAKPLCDSECNSRDKIAFELEIADMESRVLDTAYIDPTPEHL